MKLNLFLIILWVTACKTSQSLPEAQPYDFPSPVDTEDRPIVKQTKQVFLKNGTVQATNDFDGARLNNFEQVAENTFRATILPENEPINPSPWYAFKLWSQGSTSITLILDYQDYRHRYHPKISVDGRQWQQLPTQSLELNNDSTEAHLTLKVSKDTVWIAAQEVINTRDVASWCRELAKHPAVVADTLGFSTEGRPLLQLSMGFGNNKNKPTLAILSRQHPPEVTGFMALQGFLDRILDQSNLSNSFLNKYRLLVYPLMNPDGADLGHWRHNARGVDLNRDWAHYRQRETKLIANKIVQVTSATNSPLVLGMDFHSTYFDVYYTNTMDRETSLPNFTSDWLSAIEDALENYKVKERPSGIGRPVSKSWFFTQFKAVGITYEIGDSTDRDFVKRKGKISADSMMELLLH